MTRFSSAREAKEFLVSKIVAEAQREGVSLSEVERKMLYFSETGWTLPDIMQANDVFERDYVQEDYEDKIRRLICNARKRAQRENPEEFQTWVDATSTLQKEDHYLSVMLDQTGEQTPANGNFPTPARPPGDLLRLWALALVCAFLFISYVVVRSGIDSEFGGFVLWLTFLSIAIAFLLCRRFLGSQRVDDAVGKLADKVLALFR